MAEQWIDAAMAVSLVTDGPHNLDGRRSLCIRAHSGLLQTRARLLVLTERKLVSRQENVSVPKEFWWAEGDEALEQNWAAGDFSTWIDERVHVQAFGVTFALSGMLELLPADRRALAAVRLSVAGDPAWLTARETRRFAYEKAGLNPTTAHMAVRDQAGLGFVTGRAVLAERFLPGQYGMSLDQAPAWEEREWDIPDWFWRDFKVTQKTSFDWERGIFSGEGPWEKSKCLMKLSGVHFLAESLQVLIPATNETVAPAPEPAAPSPDAPASKVPAKKSDGRSPQTWWEDALCDVWGLIHQGDFKPELQADVERAIRAWLVENGRDAVESTVRLKAGKLFRAYTVDVKNFL